MDTVPLLHITKAPQSKGRGPASEREICDSSEKANQRSRSFI